MFSIYMQKADDGRQQQIYASEIATHVINLAAAKNA